MNDQTNKYVTKRSGVTQLFNKRKILKRVSQLAGDLDVDVSMVGTDVSTQIYNKITTYEIDDLTARVCVNKQFYHPDYEVLASKICVNNLHKTTESNYVKVAEKMYNYVNTGNKHSPRLSQYFIKQVLKFGDKLNSILDYTLDYNLNYFGVKTLEKSYLCKLDGKIVERPQHLFLRLAIQFAFNPHGDIDLGYVKKVYDNLAHKRYSHASPTMYNAGTPIPQMASCFLLYMDDSIEGIFDTLKRCAIISKECGGIGLSIAEVRNKGSYIGGTHGVSDGIVPMLRIFNNTSTYVNQGSRRKGAYAMYLEPWHPDIMAFLDITKNHGLEELRARDLFIGMWIPDLFMKCVFENKPWYLMDPSVSKGLVDSWGEDFNTLYNRYVSEDKFIRKVNARDVWNAILIAQVETGTPYMLYKDTCNSLSNHNHLGTIKSSNLCTEIIEYTDKDTIASCNLASLSLPSVLHYPPIPFSSDSLVYLIVKPDSNCPFCGLAKDILTKRDIKFRTVTLEQNEGLEQVDYQMTKSYPRVLVVHPEKQKVIKDYSYTELWEDLREIIDYKQLQSLTAGLVQNLNRVINCSHYPLDEIKTNNLQSRPLGIGVSGLADLFMRLRIPYTSDQATTVNKRVFENIYYGAIKESINQAKIHGPYDQYEGSQMSNGTFHFEWDTVLCPDDLTLEWGPLRCKLIKYGIRNSLLIALMPTASTAQIIGNTECIEAPTSNLYTRRVLAGEFTVTNTPLIRDLIASGLWDDDIRNQFTVHRGSIQNIPAIPKYIKDIYKTIWELDTKKYLQMAVDRAPYICQHQSLNVWLDHPTMKDLTKIHFFIWKNKLKGSYYIRCKAKGDAQQVGVDYDTQQKYVSCESCSA